MPELEINKITEDNFPVFVSLIEKLAEYENLTPPDEDAKKSLFKDAFSENPRYNAYLAYQDETPVGYIIFYLTYSTFLAKPVLYLEDIFVPEEYRKKGIGKVLFEFCREEAKKNGCCRMEWNVLAWNEPSIKFYERMGGVMQDWYLYRIEGENL
ncbi:GNAT superfamily N-acetyltransferase [Methanomicrobium sp. W14]|uniref:GNAT family N-acetyltransferase n=1 Tax=Methanomicrobium sp. W14 TaxID=2817839 RepID=UPI001AE8BBCF|nr:GNAT family N-acetyltransferase [Methanomicrobium sp. W14]MBP2133490.1 GNAT superfamily N-acetyltransferase [Methanomicrobium sp. W14]